MTANSSGRQARVEEKASRQGVFQELANQHVTYHYDTNSLDGAYSQNTWGRLAAVEFRDTAYNSALSYQYSGGVHLG